jgi:hypothetical protein
MFLDAELADVRLAKDRLAERADLRRHVAILEVSALRSRVGRAFSGLSLGLTLAGKAFDYLKARRGR